MSMSRRAFLTNVGALVVVGPAIAKLPAAVAEVAKPVEEAVLNIRVQTVTGAFRVGDIITHSGGVLGVVTNVVSSDEIDVAMRDHGSVIRLSRAIEPNLRAYSSTIELDDDPTVGACDHYKEEA